MEIHLTQYAPDTAVIRQVMLGLNSTSTLIQLEPFQDDLDVHVLTSLDGKTLVTIIEAVYGALRNSGFEPFTEEEK